MVYVVISSLDKRASASAYSMNFFMRSEHPTMSHIYKYAYKAYRLVLYIKFLECHFRVELYCKENSLTVLSAKFYIFNKEIVEIKGKSKTDIL